MPTRLGLSTVKSRLATALAWSMVDRWDLTVDNPPSNLWKHLYAAIGTCFAMAHIKAASSLAIAVTTVFLFLPFIINCRKRAHSLTWHFQAISLTS